VLWIEAQSLNERISMDVDYGKLFESFTQDEKLNQQLAGLVEEANHVHFSH